MIERYQLRLYVTGRTPRSEFALQNLEAIMDRGRNDDYELEVIDVLENPQRAEDDRIIATPTLVKAVPAPQRRIIGDLSDLDLVMRELDVRLPAREEQS